MTHCSGCCYFPSTKTIQLQRKGQPVLSHRLSAGARGRGQFSGCFFIKERQSWSLSATISLYGTTTSWCAWVLLVPEPLGWATGKCPTAQPCLPCIQPSNRAHQCLEFKHPPWMMHRELSMLQINNWLTDAAWCAGSRYKQGFQASADEKDIWWWKCISVLLRKS